MTPDENKWRQAMIDDLLAKASDPNSSPAARASAELSARVMPIVSDWIRERARADDLDAVDALDAMVQTASATVLMGAISCVERVDRDLREKLLKALLINTDVRLRTLAEDREARARPN